MTIAQRWTALSGKWNGLFHDHEIFVRTGGEVKFLRLSGALQRRVANTAAIVVSAWLLATIGLVGWQAYGAWHDRDIASRAVAVEHAEARVAADAAQMDATIRTLGQRQGYIENIVQRHLGAEDAASATAAHPATPAAASANPATPAATSADRVSLLRSINARQTATIEQLTQFANARAARAEAALRTLGITATTGAAAAQGGPFVPYRPNGAARRDPALTRLDIAMARMDALEDMVVALPSNLPADHINLSSGFGYRRDPFTGAEAMHAGLDFAGALGSPIRAAAAGTVSFVGQKSGYGNVVEVDHGHGIVTRYAHLSGFDSHMGEHVAAGQNIARMGSTGRSTGTHLHFEVRVNGTAVNPRRFLEANPDVLEVKADVGQRNHRRVAAR